MPHIRWAITLTWPPTWIRRPPDSSLGRPFTRSAVERPCSRLAAHRTGSRSRPPAGMRAAGMRSMTGTWPNFSRQARVLAASQEWSIRSYGLVIRLTARCADGSADWRAATPRSGCSSRCQRRMTTVRQSKSPQSASCAHRPWGKKTRRRTDDGQPPHWETRWRNICRMLSHSKAAAFALITPPPAIQRRAPEPGITCIQRLFVEATACRLPVRETSAPTTNQSDGHVPRFVETRPEGGSDRRSSASTGSPTGSKVGGRDQ